MIKLKVVTDRAICNGSIEETIEKILKYFYDCKDKVEELDSVVAEYVKNFELDSIVLREKDLEAEDYLKLYKEIKTITSKYGVDLFAHMYWMNKSYSLEGCVHLPMQVFKDIYSSVEKRGLLINKFNKVGVSVHSVNEAKIAEEMGASYVTFGHIYETECKKSLEPRGLDALEEVCKAVKIPVYAIGGITYENADEVIKRGAYGVCIMSDMMKL